MARYWIGTSGYSYKQWKGSFYPEDLDDKQMLHYYGERLDSVEINSTFYRFATVRQLQSWAREVGDEFTFSLKAPRRITHEMRLRDAAELAGDFCDNASALGDKLGCVLFQLPPFLKHDLPRLEDFLHQLPPEFRAAFEFRNATWFADDVFECLRRFGAALCVTDRDDAEDLAEPTAPFAYYRLRRSAYDERALSETAERIASRAQALSEVFVYFKHENDAPSYAARLRELLAPAT
jgi:uncharacterized protein YecE (DUF72 family)